MSGLSDVQICKKCHMILMNEPNVGKDGIEIICQDCGEINVFKKLIIYTNEAMTATEHKARNNTEDDTVFT